MCGVSTKNSDNNKMKKFTIILAVLMVTTTTMNAQSKHVLLEELTGTWCQYCPGGTYYLDSLTKVYPDFIGVSIHVTDDMDNTDYSSACGLAGAPTANIDRGGQEAGIDSWFSEVASAFSHTPAAAINVFTDFNSSTRLLTVRVKATFTSAISGNYRLAAILTEDGVTGASPQYDQSNYIYSGGGNGPIGGFENLPPTIPAFMIAYNDVGRELLGGYNGQPGSVPSSVPAGDTASYVFTYTIPAPWNENYISVIGLLIKPDNTIDNAVKSPYLDGNTNAKPLFISQPVTTANVESPYVFDVYCTDPDNENLTITALNLPAWITMSPQFKLGMIHTKVTLSGTPASTGDYPVSLMVSDGSRSDTLDYIITVNPLAGSWDLAGTQGFTEIDNNLGIVADQNGVLYVFIAYNGSCNVYQKTLDGNWMDYGHLNGTGNVGHIRIGSDGLTPYVAYCDPPSKVSVKKYTSGAWTPIGNFPSNGVVQFGFDLDANDHPYIGCQDVNNGSKGSCYAYDGTTWSQLGNIPYSGSSISVWNDLALDKSNGQVYALWSDYSNGNLPTVSKWDGTSWSILGGASLSDKAVTYFQNIVVRKNTQQVYVAYARNSGGSIFLDAYEYNGTSWVSIGSDIANGQVDEPRMTINDAGELLVTFIDFNHSSSVSAMGYKDGNWNYIGPYGFSNALSSDCAITSFQDTPYVMYRDGAAANKSTVRFYHQSTVSVDENSNSPDTFTINPNPATDRIAVEAGKYYKGEATLFIYDIQGSLLKTEKISEAIQRVDVSSLSAGIYVVTMRTKASTGIQKLIIQR
jgi:hypothetical protein